MSRSLRERLSSLEQSTGRKPTTAHQEGIFQSLKPDQPTPEESLAATTLRSLGFRYCAVSQEEAPDGFVHGRGVWKRTLRYDVLTRHGNGRFSDLQRCDMLHLYKAAKLSQVDQHLVSPEDWRSFRFYDTETSGLGTGAGTFAFLHAVAFFDEDELVLDQYFLASHSEESDLLQMLWRDHFQHHDTQVVSFNGKAYDWPLLLSRLIMHRVEADTDKRHIDLLPLCRRLWKNKLGSVSLTRVEEHVLSLHRIDDLPGREAPARFFAFANHQDATSLAPVFNHNAMDVCTLVTLMARIADILAHRMELETAREYAALARWHDEWGETDVACACYQTANTKPDSDWQTRWAESMHHKRRGNPDRAVELWSTMSNQYPWSVPPLIELAKFFEHQAQDLNAAGRYVETALARAIRNRQLNRQLGEDDELLALRHRLKRIQRKERRNVQ